MLRTVLLVLHLLAATIWTGGHLVLAATVLPRAMRAKDASIVHEFEEGFEKLGIPALLVQVVTGVWMATQWLPTWGQWTDTRSPLARALLTKLALLAVTVALAAHARLRVLPGLDAARLRLLAWHIVPVTALSVLFVIVGATLRTGGF
jgi:putative copper export protein